MRVATSLQRRGDFSTRARTAACSRTSVIVRTSADESNMCSISIGRESGGKPSALATAPAYGDSAGAASGGARTALPGQLARRPSTDQPRPQRPEAGHLELAAVDKLELDASLCR